MAVGKYSPTVSAAYMKNQDWHKPVDGDYDAEGFDSYGYNKDDVDRAGNHELDYIQSVEDYGDEICYPLYERTYAEWGYDSVTFQPKQIIFQK